MSIGFSRDWTTEFADYRNNYSGNTMMNDDYQVVKTTNSVQWSQNVDDIKNRIQSIYYKLGDLDRLQKKYLSVDLDDYEHIGSQVEAKTNEIKRDLKTVQNDVIRFARFKEIDNPTVIQNVQSSLVEELQQVSEQFKEQNKTYLIKLKQRTTKMNDYFTNEEEENDDYAFGFDDDQLNMLSESEELINKRVAEIKKITQTVAELAEMTSQLNLLVHEQGTIIDRIDYNIENTEKHVEKAIEEIHKAEEYQKASKVKMIVLILAVLIIGALLILILKMTVF